MNVSFGQPEFLWGILTVLWPIFLHLFHRKQSAPIPFSDLRFLKTMPLQGKGFRSFRHWILLILRMLALIFLFLGLSEPHWNGPQDPASQSPVLFVDNHAGFIQGRRAEFLDLGKKLFPSPKKLFLFTNEGQEPTFSSENWSQIPSAKNPSHSLFKRIPKDRPLVWVSDFLKSRALPKIPKGSQIQIQRITGPETDNLRIDSLWYSQSFIRKNEAFQLFVRVKNLGTKAAKRRHISLQLGDFTLNSSEIDLGVQAFVDISFPVSITQDEVQAKLISNDPCEFDNTFYFILRPSKKRQVYRIIPPGELDLFSSVFEKDAAFDYRTIFLNKFLLDQKQLHGFAMMEGWETWTPETWTSVATWLRQGNGLVLIPKKALKKEGIVGVGQLFSGQNNSFHLLNSMPLMPIRKPEKKLEFFQGIVQSKSFSEVWEMFSAQPVLSWQGGKTLFAFGNQMPFLSQFSVGNGQLFIFAAPLTREVEFTRHGLFLPVFQEMAIQSVQESVGFLSWEKSGFSLSAPSPRGDQVLTFQKEQTWIPEQSWTGLYWKCTWPTAVGAHFPGFYQVFLAGKKSGTIAVNYPKSVSARATYSEAELKALMPQADFSGDLNFNQENMNSGNGLIRSLFLLSLVCFLAEMALLFWAKN